MKRLIIGLSACLSCTLLQADNQRFITIIGPDGLPMVVPHIEKTQKHINTPKSEPKVSFEKPQQNINTAQSKDVVAAISQANTEEKASIQKMDIKPTISQKSEVLPVVSKAEEIVKNPQSEAYTIIDGEKYYESEYLESKEFNLEEKNRFYQVPMTGSGGSSWNVIERNKGVDMSWFSLRDQQRQQISHDVVALGKDYQVISSELLKPALPMSCMPEKVLKKAKDLKNQSISFWPRTPLKNDFDFELLSLNNKKVQNFKLTSFAKSDQDKAFYWPLAVFLDGKGCVVEGATGYFTRSYTGTMLQTESVEGILHIPDQTHYILFTPLEEAVDLPTHKLSNQGQITLTILR